MWKVTERILNFAQIVIGGTHSNGKVLATVEKGFAEATKSGETLPQISQKIYAVVMAGFDRWIGESSTTKPA